MKIKVVVIALFVVLISVACAPTNVASRAENFGFVFQDIPCGSTPIFVFDTTNDTLIYRPLAPLADESSITISINLSDEELESIYQKAIEIGFFEYPSKFVIPGDKVIGSHFPVSSYQLSMTNGKMANSVSWVDREVTKPDYTKADELRELMILIQDIIRLHPEVQQYGKPKAGCA
jgi:hypothetical protein